MAVAVNFAGYSPDRPEPEPPDPAYYEMLQKEREEYRAYCVKNNQAQDWGIFPCDKWGNGRRSWMELLQVPAPLPEPIEITVRRLDIEPYDDIDGSGYDTRPDPGGLYVRVSELEALGFVVVHKPVTKPSVVKDIVTTLRKDS